MTKITFFKKEKSIVEVECDGHTDYAESGEDILCSAVSSLAQTAVLGLLKVAAINVDLDIDEDRGYLKCRLPENLSQSQRHDADVILNTLYLGIADLYEGFSDFIELEVK